MPWIRLRTIVEEPAAEEAADSFMGLPRFEEAWEALKWLLSRCPELGHPQVNDEGERSGYWLQGQASDDLAGTPEIWVVYEFTPNEVVIHDVKATPAPTPDEE